MTCNKVVLPDKFILRSKETDNEFRRNPQSPKALYRIISKPILLRFQRKTRTIPKKYHFDPERPLLRPLTSTTSDTNVHCFGHENPLLLLQ